MSFFKKLFGKKEEGAGKGPGADPVLISGKGMEGLPFGSGKAEVIARYGEPEEIKVYPPDEEYGEPEEKTYFLYYSRGLMFLFFDEDLASVFVYSGIRSGYEKDGWSKFEGRLPNGLTMDSSLEAVRKAMGAPQKENRNEYAPIPPLTLNYPGISFTFVEATGELSLVCVTKG